MIPSLPTILAPRITAVKEQLTAGPEMDAWEHWDLRTSASSLTGRINARALTPVATVNYTSSAVICPGALPGFINGLSTTFADKLSYTFAAVIKRPAEAAGEYNFVIGTSDVVAATGAGLLVFSTPATDITVSVPGIVSFGRPWATAGIDIGEWCFVVYRSNAGKSAGMIGGAALLEDAGVRAVPARNVVLGNCYVPFSNCARELQFAEAMIFDSVKTEAELNRIFARSRLRMAAKGIVI